MTQDLPLTAFAGHGGNTDHARLMFPHAPRPWLDLSTGINPIPYPLPRLPDTAWTALPSAAALTALEAAAARRYGAFAAAVAAAPGTQALIQLLPALRGGDDVRILETSYTEYASAYGAAGGRVRSVPTLDALARADVAVVVNPNNPDGRRIAFDDLCALATRVGMLVVDEAFVDAAPPDASVIGKIRGDRSIVLRSFGKFYGLAGLRLGFAVAAPDRARVIRRSLGPWAVSGPAIAIGTAALADDFWPEPTRARLMSDMARLTFLLRQVGARPIGGTSLFLLVSHPQAARLFGVLAEDGILSRPFSDAPDRLRFGLPGQASEWTRLEASLRRFVR